MPIYIAMLRGINVGGHKLIKMDRLRASFEALGFESVKTYIQSGNVIFGSSDSHLDKIAKRIQQAIEKKFKCSPEIILRTADDLRAVIKKNPFAKRPNLDPAKLLVSFLASDPGNQARETLRQQKFAPEEMHIATRELYIYFPNGMGKSKLPWSSLDKILHTPATGRNWNSVNKMLEMAEAMESPTKG